MTKYLAFDSDMSLIARYDSSIHGDTVPTNAIEISDDIFRRTVSENDGVWKYDSVTGLVEKHPFPLLTPAEIEAHKLALVQGYMDAKARAYRYDDIKTVCTYAEEPAVPKFQAEGRAFRAWRSTVWARCYEILGEVNAGEREIPSDGELLAELPVLNLPAQ